MKLVSHNMIPNHALNMIAFEVGYLSEIKGEEFTFKFRV